MFAGIMKLPSPEGYSLEQRSLYMSETRVKMFTVNWSGVASQSSGLLFALALQGRAL